MTVVELRLFDLSRQFLISFIVEVAVNLFQVDFAINLFDGRDFVLIVESVIVFENLFLLWLIAQNLHGLNDEPRTLSLLNVGADLSCLLQIAETIEKVILDLKIDSDFDQNRSQLRMIGERRRRSNQQTRDDRQDDGVKRSFPSDDSQIMLFGVKVDRRQKTGRFEIETFEKNEQRTVRLFALL